MEIIDKKRYADGRIIEMGMKGEPIMHSKFPKQNRRVVAVMGLPGSGKGEVTDRIVNAYGWPKVYFGDVTFDEIARLGLEVSEANERRVREGLRAQFGPFIYADRVIEKILALEGDGPVVLESFYSWEEYLRFQEVYGDAFVGIAVHASPTVRYARLANRPKRPLTAQEARSRDHSQIENLHQAGPIAMANFLIVNERTKEALIQRLEEILMEITS